MTAFCKLEFCRRTAELHTFSRPDAEPLSVRVFCTWHCNDFVVSPEGRRVLAAIREHRLTEHLLVAALSDWRTRMERETKHDAEAAKARGGR